MQISDKPLEQLFKFTPQLYFFPKFRNDPELSRRKPEPMASGVLVDVQGHPFLLTAKHVFDYMDAHIRDIAIMKENSVVSLDGLVAFYPCPKGQHDTIDIAVIELDVERANSLAEHYQFLPWQNMNFSHIISAEDIYFFGGYINYQTQIHGTEYTTTPFGFQTCVKTDLRIDKLGFSLTDNIPLKYYKRKQRRENENYQSKGPKEMQGLSGCGIWHIKRDMLAETDTVSLVGIFIEGILEKGVLFGTHIRLAMPLLKENFGIPMP